MELLLRTDGECVPRHDSRDLLGNKRAKVIYHNKKWEKNAGKDLTCQSF